MSQTASVHLDFPALHAAGIYLHAYSALNYCTVIEDDHLSTVRPPDTLSSGEKVLWEVLDCLNRGHADAALSLANSGALDETNRRVVVTAVARFCADMRREVAS